MAYLYHRISENVLAQQWRAPGDLDGDKPLIDGEGRIVKNYHQSGVDPEKVCPLCSSPMHRHGWIRPAEAPVAAAVENDPSLGAVVAESGEPAEVEANGPAATFKFYPPIVPALAADAHGLMVCPADWVITHQITRLRETCKPGSFAQHFVKAF
jgi:hypothetical protein